MSLHLCHDMTSLRFFLARARLILLIFTVYAFIHDSTAQCGKCNKCIALYVRSVARFQDLPGKCGTPQILAWAIRGFCPALDTLHPGLTQLTSAQMCIAKCTKHNTDSAAPQPTNNHQQPARHPIHPCTATS